MLVESGDAPAADDAHQVRGQKVEECRPRSFGGELSTIVSSARRYAGVVNVAARTLVAESRSVGNEETWATQSANYPPGSYAAVSAAAAAATTAVLARGHSPSRGTCFPMVPGRRVRLRGTPPRYSSTWSFPVALHRGTKTIGVRRQRSMLRAFPSHRPHQHRAKMTYKGVCQPSGEGSSQS